MPAHTWRQAGREGHLRSVSLGCMLRLPWRLQTVYFGRRSHLETIFDRQHVLLFGPSLSQQWTCIVTTVTNVRGPSAYVRHIDHTVTEVSQSDDPQRSSHYTNLQLRTDLRSNHVTEGFFSRSDDIKREVCASDELKTRMRAAYDRVG